HASVATTQRYVAVSRGEIRAVVEAAAGISPVHAPHNPAPEKAPDAPTMNASETATPQEAPKGVHQADTRPIDIGDNDQDVADEPHLDASTTEITFENVISGWKEVVRC